MRPVNATHIVVRFAAAVIVGVAVAGERWRAAADQPADAVASIAGSWGQPPVDGKPGLTGSILTIHRDDSGQLRVNATFAPAGWSCRADDRIATWNEGASRLEWPSPSPQPGTGPCWLAATRHEASLDVRMSCPYTCTRPEPNLITLARLADAPLTPPTGVVSTFCSSQDPLRQALCTPGPLQDRINDTDRLADQIRVLDDGLDAKTLEPDTERVLLDLLTTCRPAGTRQCLDDRLAARNAALRQRITTRQDALAKERLASRARAIPLAASTPPDGWSGARHHVTDQLLTMLTIDDCAGTACTLTIEGETNYEFGASSRRGFCLLDAEISFVSAVDAFGYVDIDDSDRNEAGAGEFANFCRVDLRRQGDGVEVALRGTGCRLACREAEHLALSGLYRPAGTPSFTCGDRAALGWIEQNICSDAALAALDRDLAAAYAAARMRTPPADAAALLARQRTWLDERETCDADRRYSCLVDRYRPRIAELAKR